MIILDKLKEIDIFGIKINFHVRGKQKFQTIFGGLMSLIHISLCCLVFLQFSQNMIMKTNPVVVSTTLYNEKPGPSYIAKDSYFMMFGMQDSDWNFYIDESIYKAHMFQEIHSPTGDVTYMPIPLERCGEEHLPISMKASFLKSTPNISNLFCIAKECDGKFFLQGVYGQENYRQITISIEICQNTTENLKCKSKEEINSRLRGSFFGIQSADIIIDPNQYENSAKLVYRHYFVPTSLMFKKKYYRYLKNSYLRTDDGFVIEDGTIQTFTTFESDRDFFDLYDSDDFTKDKSPRQIMYVEMEKSNYETYYNRKYDKLQDVLGNYGGFINIFYIIFYTITYPVKTKLFYDSMANLFYNFEHTRREKRRHSKKAINERDKSNAKFKKFQVHSKPKENFFSQKDFPIKISFWEDFWSLCKRSKRKEIKQRNAAVRSFLEKMDLVFILQKFLEIEKLKILLLNHDQYHLFSFCPKPFVTKTGHILFDYSRKRKRKGTLSDEEIISNLDKTQQTIKILNAYEKIKKKENPDEIDQKLLKSVEKDILDLEREHKSILSSNPSFNVNLTILKKN